MTFLQLLQALEQQLGYHQLPLNPMAEDFIELFESSPVHVTLISEIVRAIYKQNKCQKFSDTVTLDATNAALVPIRNKLHQAADMDIDVFGFMEELCHAVSNAFHETQDIQEENPASETSAQKTASVVPLASYRAKKRFKGLA